MLLLPIFSSILAQQKVQVVKVLGQADQVVFDQLRILLVNGHVDLAPPALCDFEHHAPHLRIEVIFYLNRRSKKVSVAPATKPQIYLLCLDLG